MRVCGDCRKLWSNKPQCSCFGVFCKFFWSRVEIIKDTTSCWYWLGCIGSDGYGKIEHNRKTLRAHRVVFNVLFKITIPPKIMSCHKCDNPACVRPSHLFLGTQSENEKDKHSKNRGNYFYSGAPIEVRNEIRDLYLTGEYTMKELAKMYSTTADRVHKYVHDNYRFEETKKSYKRTRKWQKWK